MKEYNKPTQSQALRPGLYGDNPLTTVRLPQRGLSNQSLGKYWQLSHNNQDRTYSNEN